MPDDAMLRETTLLALDTAITEADVYAAIADVLDPELDEPLVKLGFIDRVQVDDQDVTVVFKLPTYWCAPNFAYLMAGDLRNRVRALPGVRSVRVVLLDHCAEDEITQGVNGDRSFGDVFADDVVGDEDLEELRRTFLRKGFLMRQDALLRQMMRVGLDEAIIIRLRIADVIVDEITDSVFVMTPGGAVRLEKMGHNAAIYLRRRHYLGLPRGEDDLFITDDKGQPVPSDGLQDFLRRSRSIRLNIMFNTSLCTSLFRTRYEGADSSEAYRPREGEMI
ncbi:MAG TPA: iron-sulfur cluster assembly protein [Ktedonobacteraceae bacterium]|nr:iron-sulfur cluster assembly protein [Ktedonobacteraceae bacterium]